MAEPFASETDLNAWLQKDIPVATARLALVRASGAVRGYCGWNLSEETATETFAEVPWYGLNTRLWVRTLYLTGVTSLTVNGEAFSSQDYTWLRHGRITLLRSVTGYGSPMAGSVTYTHGYPAGHPALDIAAGVVLSAAGRLVDNPIGMRSHSWTLGPESESHTFAGDSGQPGQPQATALLSASDMASLAPYRIEET